MTEIVYVIGQPNRGLVKIGRTINLDRRLATIQTTCPTRVEVLWHTEGAASLERGLHHEFQAFRTHGEWFDFGKLDAVAMIREAATRPVPPRRRGVTPIRNLRVSDDIWKSALQNAESDGTTITNVLTRFLQHYNQMTPAGRRRAAGLSPIDDEGGES